MKSISLMELSSSMEDNCLQLQQPVYSKRRGFDKLQRASLKNLTQTGLINYDKDDDEKLTKQSIIKSKRIKLRLTLQQQQQIQMINERKEMAKKFLIKTLRQKSLESLNFI